MHQGQFLLNLTPHHKMHSRMGLVAVTLAGLHLADLRNYHTLLQKIPKAQLAIYCSCLKILNELLYQIRRSNPVLMKRQAITNNSTPQINWEPTARN
jgi:hypothetical protein